MSSSQPAPAPPPPASTPTESTRETISAQIESLPKILEAQREFGPQFSQEQIDSLREFGPEFAEVGMDIQKIISPEIASASNRLREFLDQDDEAEFQELRPELVRDVRAAQSQRGLGDISPLGSIEESARIQQLRQNLKNRGLNIALSTAGRQPVSGIPTTTGTGQLVQNVSPESIFSRQGQIDAFNAQIFGQQSSNYQNAPPSVLGQIAGGVAGAAAGGFGTGIGGGIAKGLPTWLGGGG